MQTDPYVALRQAVERAIAAGQMDLAKALLAQAGQVRKSN